MSLKYEIKTEKALLSSSSDSLNYSCEKYSNKMSEKVTLSVLTKFVKPYNGDRECLPAFLTNCENAISLAATDQQRVLCKYILSQLEGKAQLACSLKKFDNWTEIKQFLKTTFGEKKHSTHLLVDLQNCKQLPSEDVIQYSLRIEACLTRLQSDIHYSCDNDKEIHGRIAAMEDLALSTFLLGLNSSFSHIVRCRNPKSLSEAITHATEEEKLYKLSKLSLRSNNKHCSICNKSGHSANECYKNNKKHSIPSLHHLNSNLNSYKRKNNFNYYNKSGSHFDPNKICAYCKKRGHLIQECRKLQAKNDNTRLQPRNSIQHNPNTEQKDTSNLSSKNRSNMHLVDNSINDTLN